MRKIEFRGKSDGVWVYGYYVLRKADSLRPNDVAVIIDDGGIEHIVDMETVGQSVELQDKNGVEFYEGNIIQYKIDSEIKKAEIIFEDGQFGFKDLTNSSIEFIALIKLVEVLDWVPKVIGNKFDNLELLQEEK